MFALLFAVCVAAQCSEGETCDVDALGLIQLRRTEGWQNEPCRKACPTHCDVEDCADRCNDIFAEDCMACATETKCVDCLNCFKELASAAEESGPGHGADTETALLELSSEYEADEEMTSKRRRRRADAADGETTSKRRRRRAKTGADTKKLEEKVETVAEKVKEVHVIVNEIDKDIAKIKDREGAVPAPAPPPPPPPAPPPPAPPPPPPPPPRTPSPTPRPTPRPTPWPTPAPRPAPNPWGGGGGGG